MGFGLVVSAATVFLTPSGKNTKTQIKPFGYRFRQSNHSISSVVGIHCSVGFAHDNECWVKEVIWNFEFDSWAKPTLRVSILSCYGFCRRSDSRIRRLFEMAAAVVGYKPPTCGRLRFAQHYLQRISVRVRQTFLPEPSVEKSRNLCVSTPRFNENSKLSL